MSVRCTCHWWKTSTGAPFAEPGQRWKNNLEFTCPHKSPAKLSCVENPLCSQLGEAEWAKLVIASWAAVASGAGWQPPPVRMSSPTTVYWLDLRLFSMCRVKVLCISFRRDTSSSAVFNTANLSAIAAGVRWGTPYSCPCIMNESQSKGTLLWTIAEMMLCKT